MGVATKPRKTVLKVCIQPQYSTKFYNPPAAGVITQNRESYGIGGGGVQHVAPKLTTDEGVKDNGKKATGLLYHPRNGNAHWMVTQHGDGFDVSSGIQGIRQWVDREDRSVGKCRCRVGFHKIESAWNGGSSTVRALRTALGIDWRSTPSASNLAGLRSMFRRFSVDLDGTNDGSTQLRKI